MKISNTTISAIARRSLRRASGSPYKAYEYAKREISVLLVDEPPAAFGNALRLVADALHI